MLPESCQIVVIPVKPLLKLISLLRVLLQTDSCSVSQQTMKNYLRVIFLVLFLLDL